ncbi:MAG TPA: TetR family transcriptional regulator [Rhizomicrobium sp.]|jgi:AcrR family transcriptional regulator|nr:TetR family transcriptional regulator [Rhizomicrobium sp.]
MGSIALQTEIAGGAVSDPNDARPAILAAARRVAERDGIHNLSLLNVAQEAGVPPGFVYGCFNNKNDLLLSVVSDDLGRLACAMRGAFDAHRDNGAEFSSGPILAVPTETTGIAEPGTVSSNASTGDPASSSQADAAEGGEQNPAVETPASEGSLTALARLQETVARLESRPVDAWLERRLREFERALSALEERQVGRSGAENSVDDKIRELNDGLESLEHRLLSAAEDSSRSLVQRIDACENRMRGVVSDTYADTTTLATRITALENAAYAVKPEFFASPPGTRPETGKSAELTPLDAGPESASAEPIVAAAAPVSSYLAAARQSAQAAAMVQDTRIVKPAAQGRSQTMVYVAIGSLVVFVALLAGAGFLLRNMAMGAQPPAPAYNKPAARFDATLAHPASAANPPAQLRNLAEAGDPKAELLIGLQYLDGSGVSKNDGAALAWLSRAAAHNQPLAQYDLGAMYENGRGIQADQAQAFRWFESAALKGNRRAMHSLATAYTEGRGAEKNISEAARWYGRAAELGSVNDQFNLGVLFERGMGVTQSLPDAYKWYAIAAAQGDRESQSRIAAIAPMLTPDALAAAQNAAQTFKPDTLSTSANFPPAMAQKH